MAFIMLQKGSNDTFTIVLPQISIKSGAAIGTIKANLASTRQIGETDIIVDGITNGALKAGDVFKFANHTKVYMITEDLSADGTLKFQPPLVNNVPNNVTVTKDNIPFTVRLDNDVQAYDLGSASLLDFEIDFIEAI